MPAGRGAADSARRTQSCHANTSASTRVPTEAARLSQRIGASRRGPSSPTTAAAAAGNASKQSNNTRSSASESIGASTRAGHGDDKPGYQNSVGNYQREQDDNNREQSSQGVELHQPVLHRPEQVTEEPRQ